ncbi:spore coat protein YlbD [Sediminibacillus albus]|uniref:Putative coat protein n=1 Tax=Sediminibacillus albus TaxID=407036 RepID=A0A1G8WAH6_9BACI|nr:spore coat protein YlbD [Sediminibacillus albus]SDJ74735.1 Putative coat protein [Sediminibacillus albus]
MSELHPSVKEFKEFVKSHPGLAKEVNRKGKSWQEIYEMWVLLGEDDKKWLKYKPEKDQTQKKKKDGVNTNSTEKQQELAGQFMKMIEKVDLNKVQGHMQQLNGAIANIQTLVGQFQQYKKQTPSKQVGDHSYPWSRD